MFSRVSGNLFIMILWVFSSGQSADFFGHHPSCDRVAGATEDQRSLLIRWNVAGTRGCAIHISDDALTFDFSKMGLAASFLGVWHTTSYGIMPDDFQNLKNLETTGFFGRSPYYSVPSGTTLFLLILYRPISKLLASQGPNSSQRCSDTLCKSIMIGGWEVNPLT